MDTRTMRYFLAIAREGSFTKAAESLHMTQPPLSRQMKDLEAELGVTLFDRSGKRIALTQEGVQFRERAQEVMDLMDRIKNDMSSTSDALAGEVRIACGETDAMAILSKAAKRLQAKHPAVTYRLLSGDGDFVTEMLGRGAADVGLLVTSAVDSESYEFLRLPRRDRWGVLMPEHDTLAGKRSIKLDDLKGKAILLPYRAALGSDLMGWFEPERESLDVVATFDLAYNASRFAREGFGYQVSLDGIVEATPGSGLAFRPLDPPLFADLFLVWRRHQRPSRAVKAFLDEVRVGADRTDDAQTIADVQVSATQRADDAHRPGDARSADADNA